MEFAIGAIDPKIVFSANWTLYISEGVEKARNRIVGLAARMKKMATDDPKRITHSFKVGLALTLVSVFYYVTPLFAGLGVSTMWAVITVVVVMEYTVGGTLSKGLNRAFATLVAGALGLAAHQMAILCGEQGEPILLSLFVFLLAAAATFSRFIPEVKARYDYGVTIFILTFSLVAVSSYRVDQLLQLAHQRLSTIAIGVATCLCTTIFVFPVWAGDNLHVLVSGNLEKLAVFLEGWAKVYFAEGDAAENFEGKPLLQSVLNTKPTEDSLANFARWEPCHGRFGFRHPWKLYLNVGALSRQCASSMDVLATYSTTFPRSNKPSADPELQLRIRSACREMSSESAEALRELSSAIRTMASPSKANRHLSAAMAAVGTLKETEYGDTPLSDILHVAAAASLLKDLVFRTEKLAGAVENLARVAHLEITEPVNDEKKILKPGPDEGSSQHLTVIVE